MSKQLSIDDIRERIISTEKVAHVTFYLVRDELDEDRFLIYSESKDKGLDILRNEHRLYLGESIPYNDALTVLGDAIQLLEEILERKRKGTPTQKQLYFLFLHKIPIPPTLTWGEASDLIDEKLSQIARDKQTRRLERFNGFTESDNVSWVWGKETLTGQITKLYQAGGAKFALIKGENGTIYRVQSFNSLKKINGEA